MSINKIRKGSKTPKIKKGSKTPVLMMGSKMVYNEVIDESIPYVDKCMGYWSPIGKTNQDVDKNLVDSSGFKHDLQPIGQFDWNASNGYRHLFDFEKYFPNIAPEVTKTETSVAIETNVYPNMDVLTGTSLTTDNKWKYPFKVRVSGLNFGNRCEFLIGNYKKFILENEKWVKIPVISDEEITAASDNLVRIISSSTNATSNNSFIVEFAPIEDNCVRFGGEQGFEHSPLILPNVFTLLTDIKDVISINDGVGKKIFANNNTDGYEGLIIVSVINDDKTLRFGQKGDYENLSLTSSIIGKILASVVNKSLIKIYSEPNTDQVINQISGSFVNNELNQNKFLIGAALFGETYKDYFNGSLGQIMLYRGELTEDEINKVREFMRSKDTNKMCSGSGKTFFIKNTVEDKTGNGVINLSIRGAAKQPETPTTTKSVDVFGCMDNYDMKLTVTNSKDKTKRQVFDLGEALKNTDLSSKLYASPIGDIYDEIIYSQGKWKYIKRLNWVTPKEVYDIRSSNATYNKFKVILTGRPATVLQLPHSGVPTAWSNRFNMTYRDSGQFQENSFYVYNNTICFDLPKAQYPDVAAATQFLQNNYTYFVYELKTPIIYDLDLPKIETYDGETWFTTNKEMMISPYMEATCKVTEVMDYQGDIVAKWKFDKKSNIGNHTDKGYIEDEISGYKLNWINCLYNEVTGYCPNDGTIRTDKDIKSYLVLDGETNRDIKGGLINVKEKLTSTNDSWYLEIHEKDSTANYYGVKRTMSGNRIDNTYANGIKSLYNSDLDKDNISIFTNKDETLDGIETKSITVGNHNGSPNMYGATFKPAEIVLFGENLTQEQIEHNYLVSQQNCGIGLEPFGDGDKIVLESVEIGNGKLELEGLRVPVTIVTKDNKIPTHYAIWEQGDPTSETWLEYTTPIFFEFKSLGGNKKLTVMVKNKDATSEAVISNQINLIPKQVKMLFANVETNGEQIEGVGFVNSIFIGHNSINAKDVDGNVICTNTGRYIPYNKADYAAMNAKYPYSHIGGNGTVAYWTIPTLPSDGEYPNKMISNGSLKNVTVPVFSAVGDYTQKRQITLLLKNLSPGNYKVRLLISDGEAVNTTPWEITVQNKQVDVTNSLTVKNNNSNWINMDSVTVDQDGYLYIATNFKRNDIAGHGRISPICIIEIIK